MTKGRKIRSVNSEIRRRTRRRRMMMMMMMMKEATEKPLGQEGRVSREGEEGQVNEARWECWSGKEDRGKGTRRRKAVRTLSAVLIGYRGAKR